MVHLLTACLLLSCLDSLIEADSKHLPRMLFTDKETAVKMLPAHHAPVRLFLEDQPDAVAAAGQTHLSFYNFQNPKKTPVEKKVLWEECTSGDCSYNITVVQQRDENNQVFACGTNGRDTLCCELNISEQSPTCIPSEKMMNIRETIREFIVKEGEQSALVESEQSADLYITYSGSEDYVGIHKFGSERVRPANHDKEQHYVGLVLSRRRNDPSQNKVYAFYKQKNRDTGLDSEMWFPVVTQVCMSDVGGPKNNLQFRWTSQMNARLFCGDTENKQHFSELVDTATVHADRWQDTKVYGLFRNEWGMSAVCVYTIQDIDNVFTTSPFKGSTPDNKMDRQRSCVNDSTRIPSETLRMIDKTSEMEMENWIRPVNGFVPLLFNRHNYTHIYMDSSQNTRNSQHAVLFLSLNNGGIHKVVETEGHTFVIAEYRPFNHKAHALSIMLHPSSRKLYVNSGSELVQLDVANCAHYGNTCEECVLARDPDCGWNGTHCTPETHDTLQDVAGGNHAICRLTQRHLHGKAFKYSTDAPHAHKNMVSVTLPSQSKYFLSCHMSSRHAQYTWHSLGSSTPCTSREEQCLLLIDSMGPKQVGTYRCVSEEMGYSKVLAQYQLQLKSRAVGQLPSPVFWVCLMVVLTKSLSCGF